MAYSAGLLAKELAMSISFSPIGSQSLNGMCVCVCMEWTWSMHYAGISIYQFILYYASAIGRFSEAGLLEWMRFVIFRERSLREVTAHFRADFWVGVASRCV